MTEEKTTLEEQPLTAEQAAAEEKAIPAEQPATAETTATAAQSPREEQPRTEEKTTTAEQPKTQQVSRFLFLQPFSDLTALWWNGAKQLAAWYIDASEELARRVLDSQAKAASEAKDTPWAPLCQSQTTLARRWVEGSASMARRLWRIE